MIIVVRCSKNIFKWNTTNTKQQTNDKHDKQEHSYDNNNITIHLIIS